MLIDYCHLGVADERENGLEHARHVGVHEELLSPRQLTQDQNRKQPSDICAI